MRPLTCDNHVLSKKANFVGCLEGYRPATGYEPKLILSAPVLEGEAAGPSYGTLSESETRAAPPGRGEQQAGESTRCQMV